jgi:hypothetical protein
MNGFAPAGGAPRPTRRAVRGTVPRMAEAAMPSGTRPRPRPTPTGATPEPLEPIGGEQLWQTGTTPTPPMTMPPMAAGAWTPEQMAALQPFMAPMAPTPSITQPPTAPTPSMRNLMAPAPGLTRPMAARRAPSMLDRAALRRLMLRPGGM